MTTKHTPGPWITAANGGDDPDTRKLLVGKPEGMSDFTVIADCRSRWLAADLGGDEEANARLIAAAPELLANLQGLLAWIEHARVQLSATGHMPDTGYLRSAYQAVAKAEGR